MSEYQEDIMKTAHEAVGQWADPHGELVTRVSAAILAERQRCVKVVREMLVYADTTSRSDEAIAQRILKGGAA